MDWANVDLRSIIQSEIRGKCESHVSLDAALPRATRRNEADFEKG
jgi:hypothetical protein